MTPCPTCDGIGGRTTQVCTVPSHRAPCPCGEARHETCPECGGSGEVKAEDAQAQAGREGRAA